MPRCPLCPNKNKFIGPDGTQDIGRVLLIGEAPNKDDERRGQVFTGKGGQELDRHYLPLAGLRREFVVITNSISCMPVSAGGKLDPKRTKDIALLESCASCNVYPLIEEIQPKVIVAMGSFACRAIDPDIDLEIQHGIPLTTAFGKVFPMFSPGIGISSPKTMLQLRLDWIRLGKYLKGKLVLPTDQYPVVDHQVIETADEVSDYLEGNEDQTMAGDTETTKKKEPYCLTFSIKPGTARLIRASNKPALIRYQHYLDNWKEKILFHNWLFDWTVTEGMPLVFPRKRMVDTMLVAFEIGMLPQGLKNLCRRELGLEMTDFDDVVKPYSRKLALDYFRKMQEETWETPEEQFIRDADGKWKVYKPQNLSTKLKRFFTDYSKNPNKDPIEMWEGNWKESVGAMVEEWLGEFPGVCISHVPEDEAFAYALKDSDYLLRLWPRFKQIKSRIRKGEVHTW